METKVISLRLTPEEVQYWQPIANELPSGFTDLLKWGLEKLKEEIEPPDHNPLSAVISAKYRAGKLP